MVLTVQPSLASARVPAIKKGSADLSRTYREQNLRVVVKVYHRRAYSLHHKF